MSSPRAERDVRQPPATVVWLTGLPCAGKSTIAALTAGLLKTRGTVAVVLDGDLLRQTLSTDLTFSAADRREHGRRVALEALTGLERSAVVIVALVSPLERIRAEAQAVLGDAFVEVHVDAPLTVCEERDVKGMYRRARNGSLADFTGVSSPYEPPRAPGLRLDTAHQTPAESAECVMALLEARGALRA
ncbi:MAG TPA: adenylyl-sulfate kinase [Solirubrobacteraceae bacterium]|nr:adenylyl-sulfate kinase [Solirubrobacteraceae bacterium]